MFNNFLKAIFSRNCLGFLCFWAEVVWVICWFWPYMD